MGISKGRVYLDGSTVALHGTIHILHLLQSVAHVAVCVSKVGVDPMGREKVGVSDWKKEGEWNAKQCISSTVPTA